jgi:hypothetical protein
MSLAFWNYEVLTDLCVFRFRNKEHLAQMNTDSAYCAFGRLRDRLFVDEVGIRRELNAKQ